MGATYVRAFVPLQPKPAQGIQDVLFRLLRTANLIRVFNPQDELATVLTGEAQVKQRHEGGANVGITGGRRCDSGTYGHENILMVSA
jgi:hypothetical protein